MRSQLTHVAYCFGVSRAASYENQNIPTLPDETLLRALATLKNGNWDVNLNEPSEIHHPSITERVRDACFAPGDWDVVSISRENSRIYDEYWKGYYEMAGYRAIHLIEEELAYREANFITKTSEAHI